MVDLVAAPSALKGSPLGAAVKTIRFSAGAFLPRIAGFENELQTGGIVRKFSVKIFEVIGHLKFSGLVPADKSAFRFQCGQFGLVKSQEKSRRSVGSTCFSSAILRQDYPLAPKQAWFLFRSEPAKI